MKHLFIPLVFLLHTSFLYADYTREEATEIIANEVVGADSLEFHYLYSRIAKLFLNDTLWADNYFEYHICPYNENWIFFIDDAPIANWAHPCRYVFFDAESGNYQVHFKDWPPLNYLSNHQLFLEQWDWILSVSTDEKNIQRSNLTMFPVPTSDYLNIEITEPESTSKTILIFDLSGNQVMIREFKVHEGSFKMNISRLSSGIYIFKLMEGIQLLNQGKFVKLH